MLVALALLAATAASCTILPTEEPTRSAALAAALTTVGQGTEWYLLLAPRPGDRPDVHVTAQTATVNLAPASPASEAQAKLICDRVLGVARDPRFRDAIGVRVVEVLAVTRTPMFGEDCYAPRPSG